MTKLNKRSVLTIVFASVFFGGFMLSVLPGESSEDRNGIIQQTAPAGPIMSGLKQIHLKTDAAVVVGEMSYSVTKKTYIFDQRGKEIRFDELPTPCEAVIKYQLRMDQDPICLEIRVKKHYR